MSETMTERQRLEKAFEEGGTIIRGGVIYERLEDLPEEAFAEPKPAAASKSRSKKTTDTGNQGEGGQGGEGGGAQE